MAKLSIIIPVYQMGAQLLRCLLAIQRTVRIPYEVIVVDDGSSDAQPIDLPVGMEEVRVLRSEMHQGFSRAVNMGIRAAAGEVFLFLHADVLLSPHTAEDMLDALISTPATAAVSAVAARVCECAQVRPDESYHDWDGFVAAAEKIRARGIIPHTEILAEMFALMVRRDAVETAGLLDAQFCVPAIAAYDFTARMTKAGYGIACLPSVYVHHDDPVDGADTESYEQRLVQDRTAFAQKWGVSLDCSFYARTDLLSMMDLSGDSLRVLEIGCACGATLREIGIYNPSARLYGVELNERAAALAAPFATILSMNVEHLHPSDIAERFDYIVMGDVIEHLLDPWKAVANMRELLVPGGALIASIPNVAHIRNIFNLLRGFWSYQEQGLLDRTHFRFFTRYEITKMFEEAGFFIEDIKHSHVNSPDMIQALREEILSLKVISVDTEDLDAYQWVVRARRA